MEQPQAVIFDLDGLMVDTEPVHQRAFELLLAQRGIPRKFTVEEYGKFFVGVHVTENARWLIETFHLRGTANEITAEREEIYERLLQDFSNLRPMPGLIDVLDLAQSRGLRLGVASGSPRNQVDLILRGLGLIERFGAVVAGTDVARTKPAPDVYLSAVEKLSAEPGRCVALEDSATGVRAAKAAGLRAIVVPNQYTAHQDLSHADARVNNLREAMNLVG